MADDDFDLDGMLDAALEEGFAAPSRAVEAPGEESDLDLDAMLDEAMESTALDREREGKQQGVAVVEKTSVTSRGR